MSKKFVRAEQGFTMVESMVALGLISTVSLGGFKMVDYFQQRHSQEETMCRLRVQGVAEWLRGYGGVPRVASFQPNSSSRNPGQPFTVSGISASDRWPASLQILSTSNSPQIFNSILLDGSMNAILAIYNSADFCSSARQYTSVTGAEPTTLTGAQTTLQIQPYNIHTGSLIGCGSAPAPLYIQPPGKFLQDTDSGAAVQQGMVSRASNYRSDVGLLVTTRMTYTDKLGFSRQCSAQQRFQYARDATESPAPNQLSMTLISGVTASPRSNCVNASSNQYQVEVGYNSSVMEAGSVLLCRDTSRRAYSGGNYTPAAGYTNISCYAGPGNSGGLHSAGTQVATGGGGYPGDGSTGLDFSSGSQIGSGQWVSCDQVKACNVSPSSVSLVNSTGQNPKYQLTYQNLPPGCRVRIEAVAVDTAANPSTVYTDSGANSNDPAIVQWDVPIPRCGTFCSGWGYFSCGGC